jgi:hypothetical protein
MILPPELERVPEDSAFIIERNKTLDDWVDANMNNEEAERYYRELERRAQFSLRMGMAFLSTEGPAV